MSLGRWGSPWLAALAPAGALAVAAAVYAPGCSSDQVPTTPNPCKDQGLSTASRFAVGSPNGHAAPEGAKAAGQARAGRIHSGTQIHLPSNGRNRVRIGDFLLANDKIAAYIGNESVSDGMSQYGGEIVGLEPVGADGLPQGLSQYGETILGLSREVIAPESVTVLNDGSDGKAAIVRVSGVLKNIPFLDPFRGFFPTEYGLPTVMDYVLEPGAEKITVRFGVINTTGDAISFDRKQTVGLFHYYRSQIFTAEQAFGDVKDSTKWVGFDGETSSFSLRLLSANLDFVLEISGFQFFQAKGLAAPSCSETLVDYAEFVVAPGGIDSLRDTMRRVSGEAPWPAVSGQLQEDDGTPLAGYVHILDSSGTYLSRAKTDSSGAFVAHAPDGAQIVGTADGHAQRPAFAIGARSGLAVKLASHGTLNIAATEAGGGASTGRAVPVRVQVIPNDPIAFAPANYGLDSEVNGRLYQDFATSGNSTLSLPKGKHHVIVTHGYEWEKFEADIEIEEGTTVALPVSLVHSVDSRGVMCADFHIHSQFSFDSRDTVRAKVKSAIADGLDIPVSSEHEWIVDFQPTILDLGMQDWAYSFPSEELTTFTVGHFGVVPIFPRPQLRNNGAVDWIGKKMPQVFDEVNALPEKPFLIVNHPSLGTFQNYFSSVAFDRDTAKGSTADWSENFSAVEVFNDSDFETNRPKSVGDWFALLNAGKTYWAIGNSDSHHVQSSPVGYPRSCLTFGHDDPKKLSAEIVRDALRTGNINVSGGLFLTVNGPAGEVPGQTLQTALNGQNGAFTVTVQSPSWISATSLEVIVDGQTIQTLDLGAPDAVAGPGQKWTRTVQVKSAGSNPRHWVVFHTKGPGDLAPLHPARKPFAMSNPIFFK